MAELTLIGFHLEDCGHKVVLVDPKGDEHEASGPAELWEAFMAIASNPDFPRVEVECNGDDGQDQGGSDMGNFAVEAVEGIVGDAAGPTLGRLAGSFVRNGGPGRLLRLVSRGRRR